MNRRRLLITASAGIISAAALNRITGTAQIEPTIVPGATPQATPAGTLPEFQGDLHDILTAPWKVEGTLVTFKGVILQRIVAPEGSAIQVGADGGTYRSLLHMYIPLSDGTAFEARVVSNDDLHEVRDRKTAEVTGTYGGIWVQPLIVARSIKPIGAQDGSGEALSQDGASTSISLPTRRDRRSPG